MSPLANCGSAPLSHATTPDRRFNRVTIGFTGNTMMRTMTLSQVAFQPTRSPIEVMRRKGRRFAVRLAHYVRFYADRYSAAVQYEDLVNLSAAELERRGIAPGDLHRQVADALPKWPAAK